MNATRVANLRSAVDFLGKREKLVKRLIVIRSEGNMKLRTSCNDTRSEAESNSIAVSITAVFTIGELTMSFVIYTQDSFFHHPWLDSWLAVKGT